MNRHDIGFAEAGQLADAKLTLVEVGCNRVAVKAFRFVMPGEVRVFADAELGAAKAWLQS